MLALISLGISLTVVLSSFLWMVSYTGSNSTNVALEEHGFPLPYFRILYGTFGGLDWGTLLVDVVMIFMLILGILGLWRWRSLR